MSKIKIVLIAVSGVVTLLVVMAAVFAYLAWSGKVAAQEGDDESDGLDSMVSKVNQLLRKEPFPCQTSVDQIISNRNNVVGWKKEALTFVQRGDRTYSATTPAAFKEFLVSDAKRLKPDFAFGPFGPYIAEGKMPAENELKHLQRQWDDIATITEILKDAGMVNLTGVQFKGAATSVEEVKPQKGKKRPTAKKKVAAKADGSEAPAKESYVFQFTAKGPAIVKAVNALSVAERFIVIDSMSFSRVKDFIAEALGDKKENAASGQSSSRGRRRRGVTAVAAVEKVAEKKDETGAIVTDPRLDEPMNVELVLTVYDFKSLEDDNAKEAK